MTEAEQSLEERAMAEMVASYALSGLKTDRSNSQIQILIRKTDMLVDREISDLRRDYGTSLACKPGCDYCCHEVVISTIPEVLAVAAYVCSNFSGDQIAGLKERLYTYERVVSPHFGSNLAAVRTPCPLLQNGLCSVYEVRPLRCRGINSLDAEVCRELMLDPTLEKPRPSIPLQSDIAAGATKGLVNGLSQAGLSAATADFGRALAIALERPAALDEYLKGINSFAPALRTSTITPTGDAEERRPRYDTYADGEEPTGSIVPSDLRPHLDLLLAGKTQSAIDFLTGAHPINLIRRILAPFFYESEDEVAEWREKLCGAIELLANADFDPREAFDALLFLSTFEIAYQQLDDKSIMSKLGKIVVDRITSKALPDLSEPIDIVPATGRKIRVGYISTNLNANNGGRWALGWLSNHGEDIETYAFYLNESHDTVSGQFREAADHYYQLVGNVPADARFIKGLKLDVLIFTDIGMSGRNYQFASMRLAPIQCSAWGHPVTSGLPTIDYYLSSDLMEPPGGQEHYTERLVRLPGSGLCYSAFPVPASRMIKADFGLDDGPLYLSCQNPMKLLPRWDFLYREINHRTGRPIVFLEGNIPIQKELLKKRLAAAGVDARWIPGITPSDFLALVALADVCLDTPGWNGGNTTIQALTAGTPVVTLPGDFMRGRHGIAFATMANVPELIAKDTEDYISLACNPDRLANVMANLDASRLYDDKRPVSALDEFFRGVVG